MSDISPNAPPAAPEVDPSSFWRDGDYVRVPQQIAATHPLHGVGGWLIVLAVLMILGAVFNGLGALASLFLSGRMPHGGLVLFFGFVQAGFCIWMIDCIVKLFRKHPGFPGQLTALCIVSLGAAALTLLLAGFQWTMLVQIALTLVCLAYARWSLRVRVTYRNEVQATDWLLEKIFPGGLPEHLQFGASEARGYIRAPKPEPFAPIRRAF